MHNLGSLQITTPSDREILITRVFHAPRTLVWDTMTVPDLVKRWLSGPPGWSMQTCEDSLEPGSMYRWIWVGPEQNELVLTGVYKEVVKPERIVRTEAFEIGCVPQADEKLATLHLAEQGDKTILTLTLSFSCKEARDGTLASGMERGLEASYGNLETLLAGLQA